MDHGESKLGWVLPEVQEITCCHQADGVRRVFSGMVCSTVTFVYYQGGRLMNLLLVQTPKVEVAWSSTEGASLEALGAAL